MIEGANETPALGPMGDEDVDPGRSGIGRGLVRLVMDEPSVIEHRRLSYMASLLTGLAGNVADIEISMEGPPGLYVGDDVFLSRPALLDLFSDLTMLKEIETGRKDEIGRFDIPCGSRDHGSPFIDEVGEALRRRLTALGEPLTARRAFSVILTHDVDWVTTLEPVAQVKAWWYWIRGRRGVWFSPRKVMSTSGLARSLDRLLEFERSRGVRSWWFMLASPYGVGRYSSRYHIGWKRARRFVRTIQNAGNRIGLHGSYHARENGSYHKEASLLSKVTGVRTTMHRNHYLRFDPFEGWSKLEEAGIEVDTSIGFVSRLGFRCGMASPYHPFDLARNRVSQIIEVPLVYMERPWHLDSADDILMELGSILESARNVGGTVALLFHPESFAFGERWYPFYGRVIDRCAALGAEFTVEPGPVVPEIFERGPGGLGS